MRPLPSLRLWLLSTSVLTVIAGYTLLLVLNGSINAQQRQRQHQRLTEVGIELFEKLVVVETLI